MINISGIIRWSDLTPNQQRNFGNGCGPKFFPKFLTRYLFGWYHTASCRRHDFGYARGGTEDDRRNVDTGFYKAMLIDVERLHGFKKFTAKIQAKLFYRTVRATGWALFHHGKPRNLDEILKRG